MRMAEDLDDDALLAIYIISSEDEENKIRKGDLYMDERVVLETRAVELYLVWANHREANDRA